MATDPTETNKRTYHRIAAQYALATAGMPDAVATSIARFHSQIQPGGLILDLGCGPGRDLAWMHTRGARIVGADLAFGMLILARQASGASVCQMDMRRLGFDTGRFAGVWCNAALLHLPKQQVPGALAEIARILIPGGHFFLSVQEGSGEGIENAPLYDGAERFFARYQTEEIDDLLQRAGFVVEHSKNNPDGLFPNKIWLQFEAVKS